MARLSQGLIQGLINPGYQDKLGKAVSGGMLGISDAFDERRGRQAEESVNAILTNSDISDPRVQESVQAVYSQMGQDPGEAMEKIKAGQVERRAQAAEQRAIENQAQGKAYHELRMGQAAEAEQAKKARAVALAKFQKGGSPEDIVASMPPEFREEGMAAIQNHATWQSTMSDLSEKAEGKVPFDEATLEAIAATPGMENSMEAYKKMSKTHPQAAKRVLLKQWETAHYAGLRSSGQRKSVPEAKINRYRKYVDTLDFNPSWFSGDGIPKGMKEALAVELARREHEDPQFDPTPDAAKAILDDLMNKEDDTLQTQQEFDDLAARWKADRNGLTREEKQRLIELTKLHKPKE